MGNDFSTSAVGIDYAQAGLVRKSGLAIVDKYHGEGTGEVFARIFDDMLGMPNMKEVLGINKNIPGATNVTEHSGPRHSGAAQDTGKGSYLA